jgi:hypothetical protein
MNKQYFDKMKDPQFARAAAMSPSAAIQFASARLTDEQFVAAAEAVP